MRWWKEGGGERGMGPHLYGVVIHVERKVRDNDFESFLIVRDSRLDVCRGLSLPLSLSDGHRLGVSGSDGGSLDGHIRSSSSSASSGSSSSSTSSSSARLGGDHLRKGKEGGNEKEGQMRDSSSSLL